MTVVQNVPGENSLGYAIVNHTGAAVAIPDSAVASNLILFRGLDKARLYRTRMAAYSAILELWPSTFGQIEVKVYRVVQCGLCDGRGDGCDRCSGTGREARE